MENIDELLRGVETNLLYLEAALRAVPCHKMFIAYFEQFQADPLSFLSPLQTFLQLSPSKRDVLKKNLLIFQQERNERRREPYTFPPTICSKGVTHQACYRQVAPLPLNSFHYDFSFGKYLIYFIIQEEQCGLPLLEMDTSFKKENFHHYEYSKILEQENVCVCICVIYRDHDNNQD